jgi:hypothetical protein
VFILDKTTCRQGACRNSLEVTLGDERLLLEPSLEVKYRDVMYSRPEAARLVRSTLFDVNSMGDVLVLSLKKKDLQLTWSREGYVRIMVSERINKQKSILYCKNIFLSASLNILNF